MAQSPRCASRSATSSASGASSILAIRPSASKEDAVGVRRRHGVVGDHHDRVAVRVDDLAQECEHATPGAGVQRSGRLDGVIHYCVANMPGAVPVTSTCALTNATLPYVLHLADAGVAGAARRTRASRAGSTSRPAG
jgi:hypothetical protein